MSEEDHGEQSVQNERLRFLIEQFRTAFIAVASEVQLAKTGILPELERHGIVPVVPDPDSFDWDLEPDRVEEFRRATEQRDEALRYLHLGKTLGATSGYRGQPVNPKDSDWYTHLRVLSQTPYGQQFIIQKLELRGVLATLEKEKLLPPVQEGKEEQLAQVMERRNRVLGYMYTGYMLGSHAPPH